MDSGHSSSVSRFPFAPWLTNPEQLARTLVGRDAIIRDILNRVVSAGNGAAPKHALLVGPRGMGKTHILFLIYLYISGEIKLPPDMPGPLTGWDVVFFSEEEYRGHNTLANFLLSLIGKLKENNPHETSWILPQDIGEQSDEIVSQCCFERIDNYAKIHKRRILVLIDNMQKILQQFPSADNQSLRAYLMDRTSILFIGTAISLFKQILDRNEPFFEFFERINISDLSQEDMLKLLLAQFREDGREDDFKRQEERLKKKIPAIRRLTGGNPRLVIFLYDVIIHSTFIEVESALKELIEGLREYFMNRYEELPSQSGKILDTLAQMEGPTTPTKIAKASRLKVQTVNAQIKRLKEGGYIEPVKLERGRSTQYDVTERMFRIWRQTATVAGRQRFRLLTNFLKIYYTPEEIENLYHRHCETLKKREMLPSQEIIRCIEEMHYLQTAVEGKLQCDVFTARLDAIAEIKDYNWAEDEAREFLNEASRSSDITGMALAYKKQISLYLSEEKYDEAIATVENLEEIGRHEDVLKFVDVILEKKPDNATLWSIRGRAAGNLGDYEKALENFRKASEIKPDEVKLWRLQTKALRKLKRYKELLEAADKAISLKSDNAAAWYERGIAVDNLGDHEKALESFRKASEIEPDNAGHWILQAEALRNLGRYKEAFETAEKAISLNADEACAWCGRGMAAGNLGDHDKALESFRKASEIKPDDADLWKLQAKALRNLGRYKEAFEAAEKAVSLKSDDASAWFERGISADNLGDYDKALESFRKATEIEPDEGHFWMHQAQSLRNLNRYKEALEAAEKAISLKADDASAWLERGVAVYNIGDYDKALESFRKASEIEPDNVMYWILQAKALRNLSRYKEALESADNAISLKSDDAAIWFEKAWILEGLNKIDDALSVLQEVEKLKVSQRDIQHTKGDILLIAGRFQEAFEAFNMGLKETPDDWDMLIDREIAKACLGEHGPEMEGLPPAILEKQYPPDSAQSIFKFILDISEKCLERGDSTRGMALLQSALSIENWQTTKWFGEVLGVYLRRLLEVSPKFFISAIERLKEKVTAEDTKRLLNPFIQATDYALTGNVSILENLFPEVREMVVEIAEKLREKKI